MLARFLSQRCAIVAIVYRFCTKTSLKPEESMDAAITSSKIIKFIEKPNQYKRWNIQSNSLREEIIKLIHREAKTEYARKQLLPYFQGGVHYNHFIFNQDRIVDGKNENKNMKIDRIIFSPTTLVTSQIFKNALSLQTNRQIFYGLFGTSKTFSFMLYTHLSSIVAKSKLLGAWNGKQQEFEFYQVPKMIYLNIDPGKFLSWAKISDALYLKQQRGKLIEIFQKKSEEYIEEIIYQQCPQLKKLKEDFEEKNSSQKFNLIQHINKFYEQNGLATVLLVDQINKIASQIRKNQSGEYENVPEFQLAPYYACDYLNKLRINYMKQNRFNKIIMNSSINLQLYNEQIKKKLQLFGEGTQMKKPFLMKLQYLQFFQQQSKRERATWELVDLIMFQIQNKMGRVYYQQNQIAKQTVRKQLHSLLQTNPKISFITPLSVRSGILEFKYTHKTNAGKEQEYLQMVRDILKYVFRSTEDYWKTLLNNFINKAKNQKQKNERNGLIIRFYNAAVQQIFLQNNNSPVKIILKGDQKNLIQKENFERGLFISSPQNPTSLTSLLSAQNLVVLIQQNPFFFTDQIINLALKFCQDNPISRGIFYEKIFFNEINSYQSFTLDLSFKQQKHHFDVSTVIYVKSYPKSNSPSGVQTYFKKMFDEIQSLMENKNQNAFMLIPSTEKTQIQIKCISDPEFYRKRNFNSKLIDFMMVKKDEGNNNKMTEIHFFDLSIAKDLSQKQKNISEQYRSIHEELQKRKLKGYFWVLHPTQQRELNVNLCKKAAVIKNFSLKGKIQQSQTIRDYFDKMNKSQFQTKAKQ